MPNLDSLDNKQLLASGLTFGVILLFLVPWYLSGISAKTGLQSGLLGWAGTLFTIAAGTLVVLDGLGRDLPTVADLDSKQVAFSTSAAGCGFLLLRVLFTPAAFDTLTAALPLSIACSAALTYVTFAICTQSGGSGLPFSGALTSKSIPGVAAGSQLEPPGWFNDPSGRFDDRYFDGASWTAKVRTSGAETIDPEF